MDQHEYEIETPNGKFRVSSDIELDDAQLLDAVAQAQKQFAKQPKQTKRPPAIGGALSGGLSPFRPDVSMLQKEQTPMEKRLVGMKRLLNEPETRAEYNKRTGKNTSAPSINVNPKVSNPPPAEETALRADKQEILKWLKDNKSVYEANKNRKDYVPIVNLYNEQVKKLNALDTKLNIANTNRPRFEALYNKPQGSGVLRTPEQMAKAASSASIDLGDYMSKRTGAQPTTSIRGGADPNSDVTFQSATKELAKALGLDPKRMGTPGTPEYKIAGRFLGQLAGQPDFEIRMRDAEEAGGLSGFNAADMWDPTGLTSGILRMSGGADNKFNEAALRRILMYNPDINDISTAELTGRHLTGLLLSTASTAANSVQDLLGDKRPETELSDTEKVARMAGDFGVGMLFGGPAFKAVTAGGQGIERALGRELLTHSINDGLRESTGKVFTRKLLEGAGVQLSQFAPDLFNNARILQHTKDLSFPDAVKEAATEMGGKIFSKDFYDPNSKLSWGDRVVGISTQAMVLLGAGHLVMQAPSIKRAKLTRLMPELKNFDINAKALDAIAGAVDSIGIRAPEELGGKFIRPKGDVYKVMLDALQRSIVAQPEMWGLTKRTGASKGFVPGGESTSQQKIAKTMGVPEEVRPDWYEHVDNLEGAMRKTGTYDERQIALAKAAVAPAFEFGAKRGVNPTDIIMTTALRMDKTGKLAQEILSPYYSKLEKVLVDAKESTWTPDQLLNYLRNNGVKDEELKWTDFHWLITDRPASKSVTKQEALDFLDENRVIISESGSKEYGVEPYVLPGGSDYRVLLLQSNKAPKDVLGGHWTQPSVFAHVRFDTRTDANGKKILHVAEVQSDLHQHGRKYGYKEYDISNADVRKAKEEWLVARDLAESNPTRENNVGAASAWDVYQSELANYEASQHKQGDAPFQKTWQDIAMKRVFRWAAENGYDSVSWDNSNTQFERYGSPMYTWRSREDGSVNLTHSPFAIPGKEGNYTTADGTKLFTHSADSETINSLHDIDGIRNIVRNIFLNEDPNVEAMSEAEISSIVNQTADRIKAAMDSGATEYLPRLEGMKSFYDNRLKIVADGIAKKAGARTSESVPPGHARLSDVPTLISYDELKSILDAGQLTDGESGIISEMLTYPNADGSISANNLLYNFLQAFDNPKYNPTFTDYMRDRLHANKSDYDGVISRLAEHDVKSWRVDINDALRSQLLDGQIPLFQKAQGGIKGLYNPVSRVIELAEGKADLSTVIHEVGHYLHDVLLTHEDWGDVIRREYGTLEDTKGAERFARHFENYLRNGKAPSAALREVFEAMREYMVRIYNRWAHGKASEEVKTIFDKVYSDPSKDVLKLVKEFEDKVPGSKKPTLEDAEAGMRKFLGTKEDTEPGGAKYNDWLSRRNELFRERGLTDQPDNSQQILDMISSGDTEGAKVLIAELNKRTDALEEVYSILDKEFPVKPNVEIGPGEAGVLIDHDMTGLITSQRGTAIAAMRRENVGRGKGEILKTIEEEHAKGNIFGGDDANYNLARSFVESMPQEILSRLGIDVVEHISPRKLKDGSYATKGLYMNGVDIIVLLDNVRSKQKYGAAYTLAHEISHHLEELVSPDDMHLLRQQFEREVKGGVRAETNANYYDSNFAEWFADRVANKGLRKIEKSMLPVWKRVVENIKDLVNGFVDFFKRNGMKDYAADIHKKLRNAEFLPDSRELKRVLFNDESDFHELEPSVDYWFKIISTDVTDRSEFERYLRDDLDSGDRLSVEDIDLLYETGLSRLKNDLGFNGDIDTLPPTAIMFEELDKMRKATGAPERTTGQDKKTHVVRGDDEIVLEGWKLKGGIDNVAMAVVSNTHPGTLTAEQQIAMMYKAWDHLDNKSGLETHAANLLVKLEKLNKKSPEYKRVKDQIARVKGNIATQDAFTNILFDALDKAGTELGRALRARRLLLDSTLASPELAISSATAKKGRALTEDETGEIIDWVNSILEQVSKIDSIKVKEAVAKLKENAPAETYDLYAKYESILTNMMDEWNDAATSYQRKAEIAKQFGKVKEMLQKGRWYDENYIEGTQNPEKIVEPKKPTAEEIKNGYMEDAPGGDLGDLQGIRETYDSLDRYMKELGAQSEILAELRELNKKTSDERIAEKDAKSEATKKADSEKSLGVRILEGRLKILTNRRNLRDQRQRLINQLETGERPEKDTMPNVNQDLVEQIKVLDRMISMADDIERLRSDIANGNYGKEQKVIDPKIAAKVDELKKKYGFDEKEKELGELREEKSVKAKIDTLRKALDGHDTAGIMDELGYHKAELKAKSKVIEDAQLELRDLKRMANMYMGLLEATGWVDGYRNWTRALVYTDLTARVLDLTSNAARFIVEFNPLSKNIDASLERGLGKLMWGDDAPVTQFFHPLRSIRAGKIGFESFSKEMATVAKYYKEQAKRVATGEVDQMVEFPDSQDFADKWGIGRSQNSAARFDDPRWKAWATRMDALANSLISMTGVTDLPIRNATYAHYLVDMVDGMADAHARQNNLSRQEAQAYRDKLYANENGEIDRAIGIAHMMSQESSFMGGMNTWLGERYEKAVRSVFGRGEDASHGLAALTETFITRFPIIFGRMLGYATDYTPLGAYKALELYARKGDSKQSTIHKESLAEVKHDYDKWSTEEKRRLVTLIRRGLSGMAIWALANWAADKIEIGKYDKLADRWDFGGIDMGIFQIEGDDLGGPVKAFLNFYAANKIVRMEDLTETQRKTALFKLGGDFFTKTPVTSQARNISDVLVGRGNVSKMLGGVAANTIIPGAIRAWARNQDKLSGGPRFRYTEGFMDKVQENIPDISLTKGFNRRELPRNISGAAYPGLSDEAQKIFVEIGYSPTEVRIDPDNSKSTADKDPGVVGKDRFPAYEALAREIGKTYIERAVKSTGFSKLPPEGSTNEDSKRNRLSDAIVSSRSVADAKVVLGISDRTLKAMIEVGAKAPSVPKQGKNESVEDYRKRLAYVGMNIDASVANYLDSEDYKAASENERRMVIEAAAEGGEDWIRVINDAHNKEFDPSKYIGTKADAERLGKRLSNPNASRKDGSKMPFWEFDSMLRSRADNKGKFKN